MWLIATFFCFEREYRNTTNNKNEWEVGVGIRSNMNNKGFVYADLVIPLRRGKAYDSSISISCSFMY